MFYEKEEDARSEIKGTAKGGEGVQNMHCMEYYSLLIPNYSLKKCTPSPLCGPLPL